MVETVRRKFDGCPKQEVESVIVAHCLQAMQGSPGQSDFEEMVCSNMIVDTNVNMEDCKRYYNLFG